MSPAVGTLQFWELHGFTAEIVSPVWPPKHISFPPLSRFMLLWDQAKCWCYTAKRIKRPAVYSLLRCISHAVGLHV